MILEGAVYQSELCTGPKSSDEGCVEDFDFFVIQAQLGFNLEGRIAMGPYNDGPSYVKALGL